MDTNQKSHRGDAEAQSVLDKLVVQDVPGKITVADMRLMFEAALTSTDKLKGISLEPCEKCSDQFYYKHPSTNHAWFGFALGLRCAERVELNGRFVAAALHTRRHPH
jgi:hypothetical protein